MKALRKKLLDLFWNKALDYANDQDYSDIPDAEDRYKKWNELTEAYRFGVKDIIEHISSNYEVKELNVAEEQPHVVIPENEMDELGLRKDIHPANLRCSKCGCYDVEVYLDIDGSGCRKKVKCKDDQCGFIWVVAEYGKN